MNAAKMLLAHPDIDVNKAMTDKQQRTPFFAACAEVNDDIVDMLLAMDGIDINTPTVRCALFDKRFHQRMPLVPPLALLKLLLACDQWHSSRVFAPLTGWHCKLRPNTEGR
jgi:hypothetical protein